MLKSEATQLAIRLGKHPGVFNATIKQSTRFPDHFNNWSITFKMTDDDGLPVTFDEINSLVLKCNPAAG